MNVFEGEVWQVGSQELTIMLEEHKGSFTAYCETFPGVSCTASTIQRALGGFADEAHDQLSEYIAALPLHERREICLWMHDDEAPNYIPESEASEHRKEEKARDSPLQRALGKKVLWPSAFFRLRCPMESRAAYEA